MPTPWYAVTVTRVHASEFDRGTLLGRSLSQMPQALRPQLHLRTENRGPAAMGLGEAYNAAIDALPAEGIVLFVHDDLFIHDWFVAERLWEALLRFDLVGLAGARGVSRDQPGWLHRLDPEGLPLRQSEGLSGMINTLDPQQPQLLEFGPTPAVCDLLDGVFLATRLDTLKRTGLRFDPQFRFHGYDSDLCRSALALGLVPGTWPISCTHGQTGNLDADWQAAAAVYRAKWGERPLLGA